MSCTGFDGQLAIGSSDGLLTAASFTAVPNSKDFNCSINGEKADTSDRSTAFKNYVIAGIDLEISGTLTNDGNAQLATLRNAAINRTIVKVGLFTSDVAAAAEGVSFDAYVFSNDIAQPLQGGQTISISFAPAADGQAFPDWVTLTA